MSEQLSISSDARDSETTHSTVMTVSSLSTNISNITDVDVYDTASETGTRCRENTETNKEQMVVKIGIVGDQEVGKSSFMRRYVCQSFQHSSYGYYNNSPGSVLFLEKQISMKQVNLFLGLWCSTTYNTYESALQLVCKDANVIIFMFSLTNRQSLLSLKSWHEKVLAQNTDFIPILVGTNYDIIEQNIAANNPISHQYLNEYHKITKMARKYAMKMRASLIYISSKKDVNINHVIKTCVAKVFNIRPKLREHHWNTKKALREHNVYKLLKIWSNEKKMKYLICGYLKQNLIITEKIDSKILIAFVNYLKYDLIPHHYHHHELEGRKRKSSKKKAHRKKSSRISKTEKKTHRKKSSKKTRKSSTRKRRKSSRCSSKYKAMPQSPVAIPSSLFDPRATIHEYVGYDMVVEGAIKLK